MQQDFVVTTTWTNKALSQTALELSPSPILMPEFCVKEHKHKQKIIVPTEELSQRKEMK